MFEVEVKYRVQSIELIRPGLEALGARYIETRIEEDVYFNSPMRNFAETDEALRLRRHSDGTVVLTYKGPRLGGKGKTREEINVVVGDFNAMYEILRKLGFVEVARVVKKREVYVYENFTISLDKVEGLGDFVEIETVVTSEDLIGRGIEEVLSLGDRLGLSRDWIERKTYLELMLERKR